MRHGIGITLLALALASTAAGAEERIEVKVGESRRVTVGDMTRLALGNVESAEVRTVGGGQFEVTGRAPGSTKLLVWKRSGERVEFTVVVSGEAAPAAKEETPAPEPTPAPDETVTLRKGDTHALKVKGLSRVAIGDPEVADVQLEGREALRVRGLAAGETTLLVWSGTPQERRAYRIVVRE